MAHRSDLRSAIGQLARLVGYEPTSVKINIRPLNLGILFASHRIPRWPFYFRISGNKRINLSARLCYLLLSDLKFCEIKIRNTTKLNPNMNVRWL